MLLRLPVPPIQDWTQRVIRHLTVRPILILPQKSSVRNEPLLSMKSLLLLPGHLVHQLLRYAEHSPDTVAVNLGRNVDICTIFQNSLAVSVRNGAYSRDLMLQAQGMQGGRGCGKARASLVVVRDNDDGGAMGRRGCSHTWRWSWSW